MRSRQLAQLLTAALDDIKAQAVQQLDVRKLTSIMDIMIVATGTSDRHVRSIADRVIEAAKEKDVRAIGVEGTDSAEWVLVDFGDVVVHVMQRKTRELYQLEKLWEIRPARTRK